MFYSVPAQDRWQLAMLVLSSSLHAGIKDCCKFPHHDSDAWGLSMKETRKFVESMERCYPGTRKGTHNRKPGTRFSFNSSGEASYLLFFLKTRTQFEEGWLLIVSTRIFFFWLLLLQFTRTIEEETRPTNLWIFYLRAAWGRLEKMPLLRKRIIVKPGKGFWRYFFCWEAFSSRGNWNTLQGI